MLRVRSRDQTASATSLALRTELTTGLLAPQATLCPKFLYDALGSKLFEAICLLPEYYPTRTEAGILAQQGADLARVIGTGRPLIDLGAGNCAKAATLFPLLAPRQYVPIDISHDFLLESVRCLQKRHPDIQMLPLTQDFSSELTLPATVSPHQRLFFYPGSSIGNFDPDQALALLTRLRTHCLGDGGLLIGIDLIKDTHVLEAAYDDPLGVTAAFNLNILRHVNRLIEADFDVRQWQHQARFNASLSRIEMHLQARTDLTVRWWDGSGERHFMRGQTIHTESSYKYRLDNALGLLAQAGLDAVRTWQDPDGQFAVIYAHAVVH